MKRGSDLAKSIVATLGCCSPSAVVLVDTQAVTVRASIPEPATAAPRRLPAPSSMIPTVEYTPPMYFPGDQVATPLDLAVTPETMAYSVSVGPGPASPRDRPLSPSRSRRPEIAERPPELQLDGVRYAFFIKIGGHGKHTALIGRALSYFGNWGTGLTGAGATGTLAQGGVALSGAASKADALHGLPGAFRAGVLAMPDETGDLKGNENRMFQLLANRGVQAVGTVDSAQQ